MKFSVEMISAQLVILAMTGFAAADTTATTTAASSDVTPGLRERIGLTYWGMLRGPALNDFTSTQPTASGDKYDSKSDFYNGNLSVENIISARYKLTPDLLIGPDARFFYYPVKGQDAKMRDPYLTVRATHLINSNGVTLTADLRTYAPVEGASQDNGLVTGFRFNQILNYEIPNTRLTIGTYSYIRTNFYSPNAKNLSENEAGRPDELILYLAPNASYQLTSTLQATLWWDFIQAHKRYRASGIINNDPTNDQDIEPGVNWDITPNVSLNPFLNIYPNNPTISSTAFQMILSAKLL